MTDSRKVEGFEALARVERERDDWRRQWWSALEDIALVQAEAARLEEVLRRIAAECRHHEDVPAPCAPCLAELALNTETAEPSTPKVVV